MTGRTFADDPVGTVRRSTHTGAYLIREATGWLTLPGHNDPPDELPTFGHRYVDIGGWDCNEERWRVVTVSNVGGRSVSPPPLPQISMEAEKQMSHEESLTAFAALPLPVRMRAASQVLTEASYRFTGCTRAEDRQMHVDPWTARRLDYWAGRWEYEDEVCTATDELAEEISLERWGGSLKDVASDYRTEARMVAGIAIRAGYRKVSDDGAPEGEQP